jgi:membrane protease YdiL (CAAX protease family)
LNKNGERREENGEGRWDRGNGPRRETRAASPGPALAGALTIGVTVATTLLFLAFTPTIDPLASRALALVLGFGSIGALAAGHIPAPHSERIGLRGIDSRSSVAIALLVPAAFLSSEIDNWARALLSAPPGFSEVVAAPRPAALWLQTLVVFVGIEPLIEEWFFRGVLQQGTRGRFGAGAAVAWCAFLFAFYAALGRAGSGAEAVAIGAQSFALGVAFGYLRVVTGSLLAPVLLHSAINTLAVFGSSLFPIAGFTGAGDHTNPLILLGAALSCGAGVWLLEPTESGRSKV